MIRERTKRLSLTVLTAVIAVSGRAFACPFNPSFDGGPGCGSIKSALAEAVAVMAVPRAVLMIGQDSSQEQLEKAKAQLEALLASVNERIKTETDKDKKLELYDWREKVQNALDGVNKALAKLGQEQANNGRQAKLDQTIAEANFINRTLASYLGTREWEGSYHMKAQPFELEVGGDAIFEAVRKRIPFLGGAVSGRLRVNPNTEMVSQFNALKAEYYTTLLGAAQLLKEMGKAPFSDMRLKGLAEWGEKTEVIYPGQSWQNHAGILTFEQFNSLR